MDGRKEGSEGGKCGGARKAGKEGEIEKTQVVRWCREMQTGGESAHHL